MNGWYWPGSLVRGQRRQQPVPSDAYQTAGLQGHALNISTLRRHSLPELAAAKQSLELV